ncbi:hypothetical protein Tco_1379247 [Tanacetum coccineum]
MSLTGVPPPSMWEIILLLHKGKREIDDSLYVYGKKGPQKPEISVSDDNSSEHLPSNQMSRGVLVHYLRDCKASCRSHLQPPHQVFGVAAREYRRYTKIDINHAAGGNLRRLRAEEACETIKDCAQCDKQWKIPTSTISDQTITNLKAQLVDNEVVRVMIPKCMSWLDAYDEPIGDMEDKEDNPSPQSTPQILLSIEVYTLPVTYPKEVDETIGISMEVEPLDHTKLEDLGLNTCNYDIPLNNKEIHSIDEPEPQLLPNFSPLDVNLGDTRGTDPPINPYSPGSFRMKVVKPLTIHTPPSPHVAYCNTPIQQTLDCAVEFSNRALLNSTIHQDNRKHPK